MSKKALCVGINYKGENQLQGCVNDMSDWAAEFSRRHFSQITTLADQFANRHAILDQLEYNILGLDPGDLLVFTFSGHGTWLPDTTGDETTGRDEAICPWDIMTKGEKALIIDDELYNLFLKRAKGSRIVMISDSCHSGTVTRLMAPIPGQEPSGAERKARFISPATWLKADGSYPVLQQLGTKTANRRVKYTALLMSGCKDNEYSYDSAFHNRPNGAFTYVALQELKKLPEGSHYLEWYKAIRKILPSQSAPQRPMLDGQWDWKANWKIFE